MNNKRFIRLIIIILSIVLISLSAHKLYSAFNTVSISKITLENFDEKQNKATIKIKIPIFFQYLANIIISFKKFNT